MYRTIELSGPPKAVRWSEGLASRWKSATNDRTQPLQPVGVDLGPQVRRQADAALYESLFFRHWRSPTLVLRLFHAAQYT